MNKLTDSQKTALETLIVHARYPDAIADMYGGWVVSDGDGGYESVELGLQDVLIALNKAHELLKEKHPNLYSVSETGEMMMQDLFNGIHYSTDIVYDLTKPYHLQSEEFFSFLYSLLLS